jgi:alkylation response protein AidB-like acyl-CoA dehydrogenase
VDPGDEPDEAAFRGEARAWLAAHAGPYRAGVDPHSPSLVFADAADPAHLVRGRAWQRELHAGGWAGLGWPTTYGGRDLALPLRMIWAEELAAAGVPPPVNLLGEAVAGPTILAHGTDAQRRRYLPPILTAGEIWCQLFTERGAGSDLAAVATTARRDGDGWVVDGAKIWTSGAHDADLAILLARTDWDVPKHQGLTYFVLDMRQPGVTCRPVRQMTGGAAFDEVALDRARVHDDDRLGPEGGGWAVVRTSLRHERLHLGLGLARIGAGVDRLLAELRPRGVADDPLVRQVAARLVIEARCARYLAWRIVAGASGAGGGDGGDDDADGPGPEASLAKLASGRVSRRYDELVEAMRGAGSMLVDEHTPLQLWTPATRIAGGTEEIQRTIIAERVLGLPAGPRVDAGMPFRHVPTGG